MGLCGIGKGIVADPSHERQTTTHRPQQPPVVNPEITTEHLGQGHVMSIVSAQAVGLSESERHAMETGRIKQRDGISQEVIEDDDGISQR